MINASATERQNELRAQREGGRVQVMLDFSSLKDVVATGGIVMSAYNCPKCNGMIDIPETGKILICKYCGTPIKPVDIFEKLKSLMQTDEIVTENPKQEVKSKTDRSIYAHDARARQVGKVNKSHLKGNCVKSVQARLNICISRFSPHYNQPR